ncbi:LLM class F420-dependent oxidoreductase [Mycolicibacterium wolinskyi]|uniref:LLM class F420-dependent oxidoreductase n=1 Tax=Mycolicibacterium wolinskyi TaxID=59750 RepID=A0A1X2FAG8_9MYCO|nr:MULTISPECIES: LLM class F420-dependent oxidoreductase [Mycolicibacterium]MCV7285494.1 LLM class F420-dependent oxidoreductase [Mycolicibacterium wolinskyi]MCV7291475.1 LLM class F420-dependent oxidoreductase [Mycolicibacterium goodii]ORX15450.1 LLM class F420-dependent oxidoreductase [Mycolicibacterium wolinskyi]
MRIGLSTPIVVQVPGVASHWEATGTHDDLVEIARTADRVGLEFLTCSEHVAVPSAEASRRGAVYWDPLSTLGFLAANTRRIRLATAVVVLPYHHPLEIAKRYGTLDRISGGRLVLGVGIGSLTEEFDLLDVRWEQRGERADDAITALRASLGVAEPKYAGPFYEYSKMTVQPHAVQPHVPLWVGGRTMASLNRAIRLADGWMPFGLGEAAIRGVLGAVELPHGFEVVLGTGRAVDPSADPAGTRERLSELAAAGATAVSCCVAASSAEDYCRQLERLAEIAAEGVIDER